MNEENKYSNYINKISEYEISNLPPVLLDWFTKAELEEYFFEALSNFFKKFFTEKSVPDIELKEKFPDALEEEFNAHIIELGNNKFAITLFEFDHQSETRKITLIYKNFSMQNIIREELEQIIFRYKIFNPEELNYYEFNNDLSSYKFFNPERKYITIAGRIDKVKQLSEDENFAKVKIEKINSMDFYSTYSNEYDMLFESNDSFRNMIEKESFETLENILKNERLYKAIIENEFAGVFAVVRKRNTYFKCFFIREELIFKKFRGQGYGSIFQRKVIETLPTDEFNIICGMIHSENKASLRTALNCGRSAMETEFVIKLKNLY